MNQEIWIPENSTINKIYSIQNNIGILANPYKNNNGFLKLMKTQHGEKPNKITTHIFLKDARAHDARVARAPTTK